MSPEQKAKLDRYYDLLIRWQKTINLVSPATIKDARKRHFEDSVQIADLLPKNTETVYDLGSGAGFPALVAAILRPDVKFTLIESDTRKCAFLQTVSRETQLENTQIINERIEDVLDNLPCPDCITARAFAALDKTLRITKPLWMTGGNPVFILPKGRQYQQEIDAALEEYAFDIDVSRSVIEADSVILNVRNVHEIA